LYRLQDFAISFLVDGKL